MNTVEISVVILCYKAGERIYGFVDKTVELLNNSVSSWEIVLVGNYFENTNDTTPKVVNDIASKMENIKAVAQPKRGMMGWDARSGLAAATGNYICFIDGDEQMPMDDIIRVYKKIKQDNLDFVTTYRLLRYDGLRRKIISGVYNFLFKILFPGIGVRDVNSKPKIFTKGAYAKMHLTSEDWFLDAEMVLQARRLKLKMGEIPTKFYRCNYRNSFVKSETVFEFIRNLIHARIAGFFK
ncbi:MAG: glycosyltransferase [Candidatus Omnitrophota bacterium]